MHRVHQPVLVGFFDHLDQLFFRYDLDEIVEHLVGKVFHLTFSPLDCSRRVESFGVVATPPPRVGRDKSLGSAQQIVMNFRPKNDVHGRFYTKETTIYSLCTLNTKESL
jgi:hypothetical protein